MGFRRWGSAKDVILKGIGWRKVGGFIGWKVGRFEGLKVCRKAERPEPLGVNADAPTWSG
jgi:hypothetical protein